MTIRFGTLAYVQWLEKAGVDRRAAEVHAEVIRDAIVAEAAFDQQTEFFRSLIEDLKEWAAVKIKQAEMAVTVRLGVMLAASVAILVGVDRFLGP